MQRAGHQFAFTRVIIYWTEIEKGLLLFLLFFYHCLCLPPPPPGKKEFFILRRAPGTPPSSHPQPQWTPERKTCTRLLGNQNQRNIPGWACSWSTAKTLKNKSTDRVVINIYMLSIRLQSLHISQVFFLHVFMHRTKVVVKIYQANI